MDDVKPGKPANIPIKEKRKIPLTVPYELKEGPNGEILNRYD